MRYMDDLQKQVHTDCDQADPKKETEFFTDRRKDKILLHIRYGARHAGVYPHAEPPACPDTKQ